MTCLATATCPNLKPSTCPGLTVTTCSDCPSDERPPRPCGQVTQSGGQGISRIRHALGPTSGTVRISFDMYEVPDRLDCFYQGRLVATTGGLVAGTGILTWDYVAEGGHPTWCLVIVSAPTSGTIWQYTLHCPAPARP